MPHPGSPGTTFFSDFVVTGTVGGADATSTPDEVTALLGDDFVESGDESRRLRGYELVEFARQRVSHEDPWIGLYVMVQAHRLEGGGPPRLPVPARPPSPVSLHPRLPLRLGQQFRQA
ncbi:hypothetical protein ACFU9X_38130 [Streptomyces atratus]|uniref:hypothetical protein n=1 Tax=Streptomyces atratus TaxID=1893 RepID=UPI0036A565A4